MQRLAYSFIVQAASSENNSSDVGLSENCSILQSASQETEDSNNFKALKMRWAVEKTNMLETCEFLLEKIRRICRINLSNDEEPISSTSDVPPSTLDLETTNSKPCLQTLSPELHDLILAEAFRRLEERTPQQRYKDVFRRNDLTGELSPEARIYISFVKQAFISTFILGGFLERNPAREKFLKRNLATKFASPMSANRRRLDYLMIQIFFGGVKFAFPITTFLAIYLGLAGILGVVEGEERIWHHSAGAALAGFNNRLILGPRAQLVGAILGGAFGLVGGTAALIFRDYLGVISLKKYRYYRYLQDVMIEMYKTQRLPMPPTEYEIFYSMPPIY